MNCGKSSGGEDGDKGFHFRGCKPTSCCVLPLDTRQALDLLSVSFFSGSGSFALTSFST